MKYGKDFKEITSSLLQQRSVIGTRDTMGGVDPQNFSNWEKSFMKYQEFEDRIVVFIIYELTLGQIP